jgi:hypothetical protein
MADTVLVVTHDVVTHDVVLPATLLTELRDGARHVSLEAMEAKMAAREVPDYRLRRLMRMLFTASLSTSTLKVWGRLETGLSTSKRPDWARFVAPPTIKPVLEYAGGLRRFSTGASMSEYCQPLMADPLEKFKPRLLDLQADVKFCQ